MSMQIPPHPYEVPAAPAPPGVAPNLLNPVSNGDIGTVTLSVFIVITGIFVALRLYVRFITSKAGGWDDYLIVIAFPAQVAFSVITIHMCRAGIVGHHIWDTSLGVILYELPHWATVIAVLPQPIILLVKLSILTLYFRLFSPNRWVKYAIIFGIVINICMYTAWFFIFIFQQVFKSETASHISWAQAAFGVASDVYILILPVFAISKLHLKTRKKLGIIAIFLTGMAATGLSILTLFYRTQYSGAGTDPTWEATRRVTVSCLEIDIGIMCSCMPLFAHYFPKSTRLESWLFSLRSMGSGLLRIGRSTNSSQAPSHVSGFSPSVGKDANIYVELGHRKPSGGDERSTSSVAGLRDNNV